jgi:branched-chain amino acid transport system permease protein
MMLGLYLIINRSKMGRAMRAVAEDKEVAALMGVDVDRVIVFTFILGSALAGAGGVMLGLHNTVMRFNTGFLPGIKAFTAAVLGGIGNIPGAMFGAMTLGLLESLGPSLLGLPNEYKDVIAFSVLVLMLLFRPTGLLGERLSREKA